MVYPSEQLVLKRSRRLGTLMALIHLLAVIAASLSIATPLLLILVVFAVAVHGLYVFRRHVLLLDADSVALVSWKGGQWQVTTKSGASVDVAPTSYTVLTTAFSLLHFRVSDSRRYLGVPIMGDGVDAEQHRRLRVCLRYGVEPVGEKGP